MGLTESKYALPTENTFIFSYCKQHEPEFTDILTSVDLSNNINRNNNIHNYILNFIYKSLYYKVYNLGYSVKECSNPFVHTNTNLSKIIQSVCERGFSSSDKSENMTDIVIKPTCYKPTVNIIKGLLSEGNILIAGIVIDDDLSQEVFKKKTVSNTTDIVLITGYNKNTLTLLTNWREEPVEINLCYTSNIIEIWNIEVNCPEI
jgi:hypothetical protein